MSNLEGMDTPETLAGTAKRHVENVCTELTDGEDFLPFVTLRSHDGKIHYILVPMPHASEDAAKDSIGDMMTAMCLLYRPTEMTFASAVWMVEAKSAKELNRRKYPLLADHPDRKEMACIMEVTTGGEFTLHSAPLVRENGKVGVGLWNSSYQPVQAGGRFGHAMQIGMQMAAKIPPEMCAIIDSQEADDPQEALASIMRATRTVRGEAEANAEAQAKVRRN